MLYSEKPKMGQVSLFPLHGYWSGQCIYTAQLAALHNKRAEIQREFREALVLELVN